MASLRSSLNTAGVHPPGRLRTLLAVQPPSVRELMRVATLPRPRVTDLEPDDPHTFESFEVEDPQGIAFAGGNRWFLSSQYTVRRCMIDAPDPFRPRDVIHGTSRGLGALLAEAGLPDDYDHFGDLAYRRTILYAPLRREDDERPHVVLGLSGDLQVVGWSELEATSGESACAVNDWNGLLYVPSRDGTGRLEAYDPSPFDDRFDQPALWGRRVFMTRRQDADIQLKTPGGAADHGGIQGFAFSANGRIYVTRSLGDGPWNNLIYVYSALTGTRFGDGREWDFNGSGDEIEGIAVHPSGVLYVVVADNDNETFDTDDFDLYTFRFRTLGPSEV